MTTRQSFTRFTYLQAEILIFKLARQGIRATCKRIRPGRIVVTVRQ